MGPKHKSVDPTRSAGPGRRRSPWRRAAAVLACVLVAYIAVAYALMPRAWIRYARRHPALDQLPGVTVTGTDHPGDPLNIALIATDSQLRGIMQAAGWYVANPLGLRSDLKIAADTVLKRSYDQAPVSHLYLFGRTEDVAFERPVGNSPRSRHHVRFWKAGEIDARGRPLWVGSATFDRGVGISHTTGQITHHIAAQVDAERDHLLGRLRGTGRLVDVHFVDGFHPIRQGRNGGGDRWYTDGRLAVGTVTSTSPQSAPPQ